MKEHKTKEIERLEEMANGIEELKSRRTSIEMEYENWRSLENFYRYNNEAIKEKRNRAEKTIENNIDRIRKDLRAATAAEAEAINELHRMIDNLNKITL